MKNPLGSCFFVPFVVSSAVIRIMFLFAALAAWAALAPPHAVASPGDPDWQFASPEERRLVEEGQALAYRYELDQAYSVAEKAIAQFPEGAESHRLWIQVAQAMNRLERVVPYFAERARRNPQDALARWGLATCHFHARNYPAAERELEQALRIRPDFYPARTLEPHLFANSVRRGAEVPGLFERLRRDYPDAPGPLLGELEYWFSHGSPERRIRPLIDAALAMKPTPSAAYEFQDRLNSLALWYDPATAIPLLDEALKIEPSRVDFALSRTDRLRAIGKTDEAQAALEALMREAPRAGRVRLRLARLYMDIQKYEDAWRILEEGIPLVAYQDYYPPRAMQRGAYALHRARRDPAAIALLQRMIEQYPIQAANERDFLLRMLGRSPDDHGRVVPGVPYLAQKGNYCGPASVSMLIGFWGLKMTQDQVAAQIYTGVAGTPPQVIEEFANQHGFRAVTFEGSVETWKRLLDAGVPILWLKMLYRGGGHYVVVTGYDDTLDEFIVHNPHEATERMVSYLGIDDDWALPSLRRSIVLVPKGNPAEAMLANLPRTTRLWVSNLIFYFSTGSNLLRGAWPALAVNLLIAFALAVILARLMNLSIFPKSHRVSYGILWSNLALVLFLNLMILTRRPSWSVSLLMAYYLSAITLVVLFAFCALLRGLTRDWFHPRELLTIALSVFFAWAVRAVIDDDLWQDRLPPLIIFAGVAGMLIPRWGLRRRLMRMRLGPWGAADGEELSKWGKGIPQIRLYAEWMARIEARMGECDAEGMRAGLEALWRGRRRWPRSTRDFLDLLDCVAEVIEILGMNKGSSLEATGGEVPSKADGGGEEPSSLPPASSSSVRLEKTVARLKEIAARRPARTALGNAARAWLAWALARIANSQLQSEAREAGLLRALELADEAERAAAKWRKWRAMPGLPNMIYGIWPHLALRMAPALCEAAHEAARRGLSAKAADSSANANTAGSRTAAAQREPRHSGRTELERRLLSGADVGKS